MYLILIAKASNLTHLPLSSNAPFLYSCSHLPVSGVCYWHSVLCTKSGRTAAMFLHADFPFFCPSSVYGLINLYKLNLSSVWNFHKRESARFNVYRRKKAKTTWAVQSQAKPVVGLNDQVVIRMGPSRNLFRALLTETEKAAIVVTDSKEMGKCIL